MTKFLNKKEIIQEIKKWLKEKDRAYKSADFAEGFNKKNN